MLVLLLVAASLLCLPCAFAHAVPRPLARAAATSTAAAAAAHQTICGDIIDFVNNGFNIFYASDAYDCLTSVPFDPAVASRFIDYLNTTFLFQSTLAYLKNPPQGYQQPAVDFLQGLQLIQQNITAGYYTNEYAFEADLQILLYATHDAHVALTAGALSAFSFASPFAISSVSVDGKQLPKVYVTDDIIQSPGQAWQPSAIKSINGEDVTEYLTKFAALNSAGTLEPHADWNQLMTSPALDIQGSLSVFAGAATFYPGDDLAFVFENGTELDYNWLAIYDNPYPTGPLTTGGDFYNYFVLGLLPASYNETETFNPAYAPDSSTPQNSSSNSSSNSWYDDSDGAYPNPDISQQDLSTAGSGVVTGYLLHDISTAVLSLPTFQQSGWSVGNFSLAVQETINHGTAANLSRIIIDLQQNAGGTVELVFSTFRRFFPDIDPFAGSRRRSHELANVLGEILTGYWDNLTTNDAEYSIYAANEWVITDRLNAATGRNFTSWSEYFGPIAVQDDLFSLTERYNTSSEIFDEAAFNDWIPYGYTAENPAVATRPWDPENIVLLTDGLCSSACALFLEMMTQAGARTIAVGGRPTTGPMQAAGGNRGAVVYSADELDNDISFASSLNQTNSASLPQNRGDTGVFITYAGFNLRDQVRPNDTTPLQFKYEAADCRIYYTLSNLYNMSRLWRDVASATWNDPSLCVQGSTGYTSSHNTTAKAPPAPLAIQVPSLNPAIPDHVDFNLNATGDLTDGRTTPSSRSSTIVPCGSDKSCQEGAICSTISIKCSTGSLVERDLCLPPCRKTNTGDNCQGANTFCNANQQLKTKLATIKISSTNANNAFSPGVWAGFCNPTVGTPALGCPA
ncbi:hypothetical protein AOQ84DRAFT_386953 [Glonium stellatum]|uniref:CPAF-like PDZ domain-containing protein n=1 Tax=Glonium stellatum TaxID=574774 RepID=A0A8E2F650_9PEZI|nr:hypothetical protein AOQ84DRAFT_386953 [Glonium stellatum]